MGRDKNSTVWQHFEIRAVDNPDADGNNKQRKSATCDYCILRNRLTNRRAEKLVAVAAHIRLSKVERSHQEQQEQSSDTAQADEMWVTSSTPKLSLF